MTKREVLNTLVKEGYNLMGRTMEDFERDFTVEDLLMFLENFRKWKED